MKANKLAIFILFIALCLSSMAAFAGEQKADAPFNGILLAGKLGTKGKSENQRHSLAGGKNQNIESRETEAEWMEESGNFKDDDRTETIIDNKLLKFDCSPEGLDSRLLDALYKAAKKYYKEYKEPFVITSGKRSLRKQAELMAAFSLKQLEAMYCRNGYPDYIRRIAELPEPFSADDVYRILALRSSGFISKHLTGWAVDISPVLKAPMKARKALKDADLTVLDETEFGVKCFHVCLPETPSVKRPDISALISLYEEMFTTLQKMIEIKRVYPDNLRLLGKERGILTSLNKKRFEDTQKIERKIHFLSAPKSEKKCIEQEFSEILEFYDKKFYELCEEYNNL